MRLGLVFFLIVTALAVGWFAPGLSGPGANRDATFIKSAAQASAAAAEKEAQKEAWLAGATRVTRAADGHFYLDARVEGEPVHFLVDTGASIVALTARDARAAGLEWDGDAVHVIGHGASGPVRGVPVRLERLELDGTTLRDVDAAIIPEGLDVSLLGQSFLARMGAVQVEGNALSITP